MEMQGTVKALFGALVMSASLSAHAATIPADMIINLDAFDSEVVYTQSSLSAGGVDTWTLNLNAGSGVTTNFTTAINNSGYVLDRVELWDATGTTELAEAVATVTTLAGVGTWSGATLNKWLAQGTYLLKVFGDAGMGYQGTVSAVPLPGAVWLFGTGLLGFMMLSNRRKV